MARLLGIEMWTAGPDGSAADSGAWRRKTGQTASEVSGWGRLDAVHPDDRAYVREAWRNAVARGDRYSARYRLRRPDGTYTAVHSRGLPVKAGSGEIEWWHGVCGADELLTDTAAETPTGLSGEQVRAARGFMAWSITDLSRHSGVSVSSIRRLESEGSDAVTNATWLAIADAFSRHGVEFRQDGTGTLGVFLRRCLAPAANQIVQSTHYGEAD